MKAIEEGIDQFIDDIMLKVDTAEESLGFKKEKDPIKRLAAYLQKPMTYVDAVNAQQEAVFRYQAWEQAGAIGVPPKVPPLWSWETQRAYLPKDWEHDWLDYQDLLARANRGEFTKRMAQ